jgi:hypothetical protein
MASGGATASAPNSHLMKLVIPILVDNDFKWFRSVYILPNRQRPGFFF